MRARVGIALVGILIGAAIALPATSNAQVGPSFDLATVLDLARIDAPPAGVGVQIHADFPEDAPLIVDGVGYHSVTIDLTPTGGVITRNAVAAGADSEDDRVQAGADECDDPAFKPTGVKWARGTMPILWRMDLHSIPDYLKMEKTKLTVRAAHRVWPQSKTVCANADRIGFAYSYQGPTGKDPNYDELNIVDFGEVGSRALAVNYTWYRGSEIVEVDLRLNKDYSWTNVPGVKRYQVKNVVAHELGHQFGLDDLGSPHGRLTMYALIGPGELNKATLGMGDLKGAWALTP